MKRSLRTSVALATTALLSLLSVFPAAATTLLDTTVTLDCDDFSGEYIRTQVYLGSDITLSLVDCQDLELAEMLDTGNVSVDSGVLDDVTPITIDESPEAITYTGAGQVLLFELETTVSVAGFEVKEPTEMSDPSGVLLGAADAVIGMTPDVFTTEDDAISASDGTTCEIELGEHVYTSQRLEVTEAGEYNIRVTGTDPMDYDFQFDVEMHPNDDALIAVYSGEFDPTDPTANSVGCNDDMSDNELVAGGPYLDQFMITADGDLINTQTPLVTTDLEPGNYTIVTTYFNPVSAADWAVGSSDFGMVAYDWTPGEATVSMDVWGPEGGGELVDEFALASTGVDPALGLWSGLALAGTGVAITVARRRAIRA